MKVDDVRSRKAAAIARRWNRSRFTEAQCDAVMRASGIVSGRLSDGQIRNLDIAYWLTFGISIEQLRFRWDPYLGRPDVVEHQVPDVLLDIDGFRQAARLWRSLNAEQTDAMVELAGGDLLLACALMRRVGTPQGYRWDQPSARWTRTADTVTTCEEPA